MKFIFLISVLLAVAVFQDAVAQDNFERLNAVDDKSEVRAGDDIEEKIRRNFFLTADVTKTECYVGEPLMAVFKAYSRLDANSQVIKRPSLAGFSVIEMVDAYNNQPEIEQYKGEYYYVHLIRKVQLFPIQPGTFIIEPAEVESVIHLRKNVRSKTLRNLRDLFRRRDSDPSLERQMTFQTSPLTVHVNSLPEKGQPTDFAGAVGTFMIDLQMDETAIRAREPATVRLVIGGTGNFPLVTEPHISWPSSAEISGPSVSEQVNKYNYPLSGTKIYQFSIEHRDTGTFVIPPVKLSYFDPALKSYKVTETKAIKYTVAPPVAGTDERTQIVFKNEKETPVHFYYFAVIAVVIVSLIIYFAVRPAKKSDR
jgi:hypothetical protein